MAADCSSYERLKAQVRVCDDAGDMSMFIEKYATKVGKHPMTTVMELQSDSVIDLSTATRLVDRLTKSSSTPPVSAGSATGVDVAFLTPHLDRTVPRARHNRIPLNRLRIDIIAVAL